MKPSSDLIKFIREQEGFSPDAYRPFTWDRPTIGYGSTFYKNGDPVLMGDNISLAEAIELLTIKLDNLAQQLSHITNPNCKQQQFDAVLSLCYNVGITAFASSATGIMFGKGQDISDRFKLWNKSDGKVIPGLIIRRKREREIYANNNYSN